MIEAGHAPAGYSTRPLQEAVSRLVGTAGVDPLHVSGHILYTFEDAMEADECADGAGEVRSRAGVWRVDDE
jgi:hypothetical protein